MDWANEEYVKVYRRETDDDLILSWQALALWRAVLLKLDRAGLLGTKRGPRGLAVLTRIPLEVVEAALPELLEDGRLQVVPEGYFAPNFLSAQETPHSDKQRKRDERQRRADDARLNAMRVNREPANVDVTRGHAESLAVTPSHAASQPVTLSYADPKPEPEPLEREPRAPAHAIPPSPAQAAMPAPAPAQHPTPAPPITQAAQDHADRRRRLIADAWALAGAEFRAVQRDGIDPDAPNMWAGLPAASSVPMTALRAIVDELLIGDTPDYDGAAETIRRRVLVAAAEARRRWTAEYMTPARMWRAESFAIESAMSPEQVNRKRFGSGERAGPRSSAARAPSDGRNPVLQNLLDDIARDEQREGANNP